MKFLKTYHPFRLVGGSHVTPCEKSFSLCIKQIERFSAFNTEEKYQRASFFRSNTDMNLTSLTFR